MTQPAAAGTAPVVIVGGGPVGMCTGLALARYGLPSIILEARAALTGEGSRSICTQGDVLATLERLGCAEPMVAKGVWWTLGRTYFREAELFQTPLPSSIGEEALPPFINLGQQDVEAFILEAVEKQDLIDLRWSHSVTDVRQDPEQVTLQVEGPEGAFELQAPYAVACDGPRSSMRKLLGIDLPGHSYDDRFLIADIRADLPFPNERRFYFDPPFNPGRQVLIHQQPDGIWRIDWQVPPDTDIEEERRSGRLEERIRAVTGDVDYELVWLSSYRFHQRIAERFSSGRMFLAGDAVHLMAPFGARGLNSGVHDVENLTWKLWLVLPGAAPERLLDTYHDERYEAAEVNVGTVTKTMRFLTPRNRAEWAMRNTILRASLYFPPLRRLVDSGKLYQPTVYRRSPIIDRDRVLVERLSGWRGLPEPGAVAPDGPCRVLGHPEVHSLRHLVGDGFLILAFPPDEASARQVAGQAQALDRAIPTKLALVAPPGRHTPDTQVLADAALLSDPDGPLRRLYAPDSDRLYLVRPDRHIVARGRTHEAAKLPEWLSVATAQHRQQSA